MMTKKAISERSTGMLLLLLLLVGLNGLEAVRSSHSFETRCKEEKIFVEISGRVPRPGVYGFKALPTLGRLLSRSGRAAEAGRNGKLPDLVYPSGTRVMIQERSGKLVALETQMTAFHKMTLSIPISLNQASAEDLTALSGIGPKTADSIVQERVKRGGFEHLDDLLSVRGIGKKRLRQIRPLLKL